MRDLLGLVIVFALCMFFDYLIGKMLVSRIRNEIQQLIETLLRRACKNSVVLRDRVSLHSIYIQICASRVNFFNVTLGCLSATQESIYPLGDYFIRPYLEQSSYQRSFYGHWLSGS